MEPYQGRQSDLTNRLNKHLKKLTGKKTDFFSKLNPADLLDLKTVLADVNNLLTLRMTTAAADWIFKYFRVSKNIRHNVLIKIDESKPNSNGFDIHISDQVKIIAEVKCIVPINNGGKFGGAQRNSILDDAIKLKNGKRNLSDTTEYLKFLFLIDLGVRTEQAVAQLFKHSTGTSDKPLRKNRHEIKEHILILSNDTKREKFFTDKIYVRTLRLTD